MLNCSAEVVFMQSYSPKAHPASGKQYLFFATFIAIRRRTARFFVRKTGVSVRVLRREFLFFPLALFRLLIYS
jgi:hypothetical protein